MRCSECGREFQCSQGFHVHRSRSNQQCAEAVPIATVPQDCLRESSLLDVPENCESRFEAFSTSVGASADMADIQNLILTSRTQRRFFNNVPVRVLQLEREATMQLVSALQGQLQSRLQSGMSKEQIDKIIGDVCNVFHRMHTDATEDSAVGAMLHSCGMSPQKPVRRNLHDPVTGKETGAICYDLPIDVSVQLLLQSRRPLWEMLHGHACRWATRGAERHGKEPKIYKDVPDGSIYRNHPKLGDAAAAAALASLPESELRKLLNLSLMLYYDEVEVTNPLGAAAGVHKLGLFYYSLIDLPPEHRMNLNNIQLATVVKYKDLSSHGGAEVISGPAGQAYGAGSCIAACMERLSDGVALRVPWAATEFRLHAWVLLWSADYPAAAMVGGFKASTSADRFCRQCTLDQKFNVDGSNWKQPFSFLKKTMSASVRMMELRTMSTYEEDQNSLAAMTTKAAREAFMKRIGISVIPAPCWRVPFFDWTACLPQDIMHVLLEGVVKLELAAMVFMFVRVLKWCTLDELNQMCGRYQGWTDHHSPLHFHEVLLEGKREGADEEEDEEDAHVGGSFWKRGRPTAHKLLQPKRGCHVHGTAAQVLEFTIQSLHALAPVVQRPEHAVWQSWKTLVVLVRLLLEREFTKDQVSMVDDLVQQHHVKFKSIEEYKHLFLPKHHFCTHIPVDILNFGPSRMYWCMRFEAMNQVFKQIAAGGNFREILKRCAHHACVRTALISVWNKYSWGMTEELAGGELERITTASTAGLGNAKQLAATAWLVNFNTTELEVTWLHKVRHAGMILHANVTWVLWHDTMDPFMDVKLAKLVVLARVAGSFFVGLSCPNTRFVGEDHASGLKLLQMDCEGPADFCLHPLDDISVLPQFLIHYNADNKSETPVYMLIGQAGEQPPR